MFPYLTTGIRIADNRRASLTAGIEIIPANLSLIIPGNSVIITNMKILIVDDSEVMRRIHKNTLKEQNIPEESMLEAADGVEALKIALAEQVDLFLVDWNMPKLDGLSFVKKLRGMGPYTDTPVIMITSEAAKYSVIEAINAGVTNYVVKPIRGNVLWEKISPYFGKQG
jgi:two-component system chemotaxis response regulator CheY